MKTFIFLGFPSLIVIALCLIGVWRLDHTCSASLPWALPSPQQGTENGAESSNKSQQYGDAKYHSAGPKILSLPVKQPDNSPNQSQPTGSYGQWKPNDWGVGFWCEVKVTDVAIALFTFFIVLVGIGQGYWLYAAVNESTRQHIVTNRAFVFIRHFFSVATGQAQAVEFWRITPIFENSGNTPTKYMTSYHSAVLRDDDLPEDFKYPDTAWPPGAEVKINNDFIGPHAQLNGMPYNIAIDDVLAMQQGTKKFFIWGWIDYNDVFDKTERHRTEYCYRIIVILDPRNPNNANAVSAGIYGWHNAVDDQCYRKPNRFTPPERPA